MTPLCPWGCADAEVGPIFRRRGATPAAHGSYRWLDGLDSRSRRRLRVRSNRRRLAVRREPAGVVAQVADKGAGTGDPRIGTGHAARLLGAARCTATPRSPSACVSPADPGLVPADSFGAGGRGRDSPLGCRGSTPLLSTAEPSRAHRRRGRRQPRRARHVAGARAATRRGPRGCRSLRRLTGGFRGDVALRHRHLRCRLRWRFHDGRATRRRASGRGSSRIPAPARGGREGNHWLRQFGRFCAKPVPMAIRRYSDVGGSVHRSNHELRSSRLLTAIWCRSDGGFATLARGSVYAPGSAVPALVRHDRLFLNGRSSRAVRELILRHIHPDGFASVSCWRTAPDRGIKGTRRGLGDVDGLRNARRIASNLRLRDHLPDGKRKLVAAPVCPIVSAARLSRRTRLSVMLIAHSLVILAASRRALGLRNLNLRRTTVLGIIGLPCGSRHRVARPATPRFAGWVGKRGTLDASTPAAPPRRAPFRGPVENPLYRGRPEEEPLPTEEAAPASDLRDDERRRPRPLPTPITPNDTGGARRRLRLSSNDLPPPLPPSDRQAYRGVAPLPGVARAPIEGHTMVMENRRRDQGRGAHRRPGRGRNGCRVPGHEAARGGTIGPRCRAKGPGGRTRQGTRRDCRKRRR